MNQNVVKWWFTLFMLTSIFICLATFGHAQQTLSDAEIQTLRSQAQQHVQKKQLDAALEKMTKVVIARPTDLSARFFRAQILTSLGRGAEIASELQLMTTLDIPEADKQKARQLLASIEMRDRRFTASITFKAGIGYGDNVNSWPKGGLVTSKAGIDAAMPDPIYRKYNKKSDSIRSGSAKLKGSYLLSQNRALKANFGMNFSFKDGPDTVSIDNKYQSAQFGLEHDFDSDTNINADIQRASLDRHNVKHQKTIASDISITAYNLEISQKLRHNFQIGGSRGRSENRHSNIDNAENLDANTLTNSLFLGMPLSPTTYTRLTVSNAKTRAKEQDDPKNLSRNSDIISALLVKVLPREQRLILTASFSDTIHHKKLINLKEQQDETDRYTFSYTIKGRELWQPLGELVFGIDTSYSKTDSNQKSARVHSRTTGLSLSRKFDL